MRAAIVALAVAAGCAQPAAVAPPPAKPIAVAPKPPPPPAKPQPIHADSPLFADLPSGSFALLAGNIYELQHWLDSAFGSAVLDLTDAVGMKSFRTWMTCFGAARGVRTASALAIADGRMTVRSVMLGITTADIVRCAHDAGFTVAVDPDGKYVRISFEMRGKMVSVSNLELRDHAIYGETPIVIGTPLPAPTRAELEADQAAAATSNMAGDEELIAIARAVDQQPMWFAASGKQSPWPAQFGAAHGTMDLRDGLHVVLDVEVIDHALREQMVAGITHAKQSAVVPQDMRDLLAGLQVAADGNAVHFAIDWTAAQVKLLSDYLAKMIGARRPSPSSQPAP
jgi:hypothetical protein